MPRALFPAIAPGVRAGGVLLAATIPLAGCGAPPELDDPPGPAAPRTTTTGPVTPTTSALRTDPAAPSGTATPAFGELTAVDCRGNPTGDQVIALLRRSPHLLASGTRVTVLVRPLCAGTWQYTVVEVPGREPLQVVSSGRPTSLTLVTAGTDVCGIPVRTSAPPGIRAVACDAVPPQPPGA